MAVSGCTSIKTYGLDQVNSELPIEVGDKVTIFVNDSKFSQFEINVIATSETLIRGTMVSDPKTIKAFRCDDIGRIEARQFDSGKTVVLVIIVLLVAIAGAELGEDIVCAISFGSAEGCESGSK